MGGQIWNETFPPPEHMAGMGVMEIPLPEGYQAKNWKVQLRWPHEMMKVACFTDTVTDGNCDGEGQGSSDNFNINIMVYYLSTDGPKNPKKDAKDFIITLNHIFGMQMLFSSGSK